jgi:hypothetical protein
VGDIGNGFARGACVVSRGVEGVWLNDIEEVMREQATSLRGRLCGTDLETPVHRYGIATDDLSGKLLA